MRGLFCDGKKAKDNEEYRLILKKRLKTMWGLFVAGLLTAALGILLSMLTEGLMSTRQTAFILGLGTGLSLGAFIAIRMLHRTLGSEERLKEERLKEVDEREIEVRNRALQATAKLVLAVIYLLAVIGGLFIEEIERVCILLGSLFLLSNLIFQKYYGKKL